MTMFDAKRRFRPAGRVPANTLIGYLRGSPTHQLSVDIYQRPGGS